MIAACTLSFLTGFLSLCLEILWVRLFGFTNHSLPQAFAFVLVFYLLGIAFGALLGKRFCNAQYNLWFVSGIVLIASSLIDLGGPLIYALFARTVHQLNIGATMIFITAFLKAVIFPIAHHLGTSASQNEVGRQVSRVYVSNIIGATFGPIVTSAFLLAYFTTQQAFIICALLTFFTALGCLLKRVKPEILAIIVVSVVIFFITIMTFNPNYLIAKIAEEPDKTRRIIENQYGIITTYEGAEFGDIIYGGNVYDGRTNLDPVINSNRINRLIILSALQEKPEHVLMIGLSIGTWLKLTTSFPHVKTIDVIEINPGYQEAIKDYPPQLHALEDSRVHLVIDDGRRWLKAHSNKKYDLIVMNTTFYWRSYISNLLSKDFLQIIKNHMRPNALLAYNMTGSPDALKTATILFRHAYLYENFIIAADFDWRKKLHDQKSEKIISGLLIDGKPLFPANQINIIRDYLNEPIVTLPEVEAQVPRKVEIITDDNLITEYKHGREL